MDKIYKIKIPIGDWSDDGHGDCEYYKILSTHSVEDLRKAYYKSEKLTRLTFRHDYNEEFISPPICTDYQNPYLTEEHIVVMKKYGYDSSHLFDSYSKKYLVEPDNMKDIILWFIGLSLEDFSHENVNDLEYVTLSEYGDGGMTKRFSHQFGYGCFDE